MKLSTLLSLLLVLGVAGEVYAWQKRIRSQAGLPPTRAEQLARNYAPQPYSAARIQAVEGLNPHYNRGGATLYEPYADYTGVKEPEDIGIA
jgi:hypothetical protein